MCVPLWLASFTQHGVLEVCLCGSLANTLFLCDAKEHTVTSRDHIWFICSSADGQLDWVYSGYHA